MDLIIIICMAAYAAIVISAVGIVKKDDREKEARRQKEKGQL